ncbi:MAG: hypothetical protein A3K75_02750 [Euryarchaeota archaeon RBG_13_61_15]|nr:MAG: hypothetical protein A3K75_02750 [Euryarchaeota archaeon RBG_13_61_15]
MVPAIHESGNLLSNSSLGTLLWSSMFEVLSWESSSMNLSDFSPVYILLSSLGLDFSNSYIAMAGEPCSTTM